MNKYSNYKTSCARRLFAYARTYVHSYSIILLRSVYPERVISTVSRVKESVRWLKKKILILFFVFRRKPPSYIIRVHIHVYSTRAYINACVIAEYIYIRVIKSIYRIRFRNHTHTDTHPYSIFGRTHARIFVRYVHHVRATRHSDARRRSISGGKWHISRLRAVLYINPGAPEKAATAEAEGNRARDVKTGPCAEVKKVKRHRIRAYTVSSSVYTCIYVFFFFYVCRRTYARIYF